MFAGWLIHGELVLMASGLAAAERGAAGLTLMVALVWAAAVAGDVTSLTAGRLLGRSFLERRAPRAAATVDAFFVRHGGKALFLGRFTGLLRSTMPFVAGASGVPVRKLLPYSLASGFVWSVTFVVIGYVAAESFQRVGDAASRVAFVALLHRDGRAIVRTRWRGARDAPATAGPPSNVRAAGAMNSRTSVTSTSTAVARPMPVILITGSGSVAKPRKTAIMIAPAAVMMLRVPPRPRRSRARGRRARTPPAPARAGTRCSP